MSFNSTYGETGGETGETHGNGVATMEVAEAEGGEMRRFTQRSQERQKGMGNVKFGVITCLLGVVAVLVLIVLFSGSGEVVVEGGAASSDSDKLNSNPTPANPASSPPTMMSVGCHIGSLDCSCTQGGSCDAGLTCSSSNLCKVVTPSPTPTCHVGSLGCACTLLGGVVSRMERRVFPSLWLFCVYQEVPVMVVLTATVLEFASQPDLTAQSAT